MPTLWGKHYDRSSLLKRIGRLEQIAGVRLVTLENGRERGVRVLEFRTGSGFVFEVLVDRGFDIGHCSFSGKTVSWQSSAGINGPWFYEPEGFGFLRTFGGGLLTTCGLDHALSPAQDIATQYHYGPISTENYGLHGRISHIPARLTGYGERWEDDECILWAEAEVIQSSALTENLLLRRRIEARVGSTHLSIHDEVENIGYSLTPHMYLYHVNFGFPIVDEGAEILIPTLESIAPQGDDPTADFTKVSSPVQNYEERVYEYQPNAEPGGTVPIAIINRAQGLGAYQIFQKDQLPHPLIWHMLGEGNYVVALEPSTNDSQGRLSARERGQLRQLAPGEKQLYDLQIGILDGNDAIAHFTKRIQALRKP